MRSIFQVPSSSQGARRYRMHDLCTELLRTVCGLFIFFNSVIYPACAAIILCIYA